MLTARDWELAEALKPGDRRAAARAVLAMLGLFPAGAAVGADVDVKELVAGYVSAVEDLPAWAVEAACRRFIRGEAPGHNKAFRPSSAELAHLARQQVIPVRAEQITIRRILSAEVVRDVPKADRERVAMRLSELSRGIASPADDDGLTTRRPKSPQSKRPA
ncbi:hypothetical protein BLTE_13520 [Blastochloris tepida]|uniref:Uncharacterized protein n=1 Tax=Blastochloris tepida TaxID=2233851 RepID=A0A348FZD4_9HYPH|nr:hypothetical protein [Blastochloris tepida]BBF92667.1 hypothetical protein BLTE_13520 [Blastochloris tepida]